jgi:hypothetical protein
MKNIEELKDDEILAVANPFWDDLIKYSNNANYGMFVKNFSDKCLGASNEA